MGARISIAIVVVALFATAATPRPEPTIPGVSSLQWQHLGSGWTEHSALVDSGNDDKADVVTAGGLRSAIFHWFGGNPLSLARQVLPDEPVSMRVLDGVSGEVLWTHVWDEGGPSDPNATRYTLHYIEGVAAGELDDEPGEEVLVLRRVHTGEGATKVGDDEITTLYDAADGSVKWESVVDVNQVQTTFSFRWIDAVQVQGRDGVLLRRRVFRDWGDTTTTLDVATVGAAGLNVVASVPPIENTVVFPLVASDDQGIDLFTAEFDEFADSFDFEGVLRARRIDLGGSPDVSLRWSLPRRAGITMRVTEGRQPSLVVMRQDGTRAYDPADGSQRWRHPAATDSVDGFNGIGEGDVNGDGIHDVIVSPTLGKTAYRDDFTTELYALDGERGTVLWKHYEPTAKYGARRYAVADFDGNGQDELAVGMLQQDGFPFIGHFEDDPAQVAIYDLADASPRCVFPVDRLPSAIRPVEVNGNPANTELVVVGYSGVVSALRYAYPACDARS